MRSLRTVFGFIGAFAVIAFLLFTQASAFRDLGAIRGFFAGLINRGASYDELVRLRVENEALHAERAALLEAGIPPFSYDIHRVPVYSRYPYGTQGIITVAAGSEQGIREGMPVLMNPGALLGKVTRVRGTQSEVMTVWNPAWRSSVRFEKGDAKALVTGGETPQLSLIPKNKVPPVAARVVNDDPSFPYGLFLGTMGALTAAENEPWFSAPLEMPYDELDVREVLILVNFP